MKFIGILLILCLVALCLLAHHFSGEFINKLRHIRSLPETERLKYPLQTEGDLLLGALLSYCLFISILAGLIIMMVWMALV